VDDAKDIDWICTGSKVIWQSEAIKYLREIRKTNNVAQRRRTINVAQRRRNHKIKNEIDVKITYFNKREREKRVRRMILRQKLTLPLWWMKEKKLGFWWRLTRERKKKEKTIEKENLIANLPNSKLVHWKISSRKYHERFVNSNTLFLLKR